MSGLSPLPGNGEKPEQRIKLLGIFFILIFLVYSARLFSITRNGIDSGDASKNIRRTTVIPSPRGEIYDRNFDQPLAYNTDSFTVRVTPHDAAFKDDVDDEQRKTKMLELFDRLSGILGMSREQIERKIPPRDYNLYQPVEIAAGVSFKTVAALAENADTLPGVSWQSRPTRSYAENGSLSHIIGYLGNITQDELTMLYNKEYRAGDLIGKAGIERQYDEILRGKDGWETRTVDANGRQISGEPVDKSPPVMGKNLVLSIDRSVQTLAEKALGNRTGAAVVLRPATGEVLAMVSYPWYDPKVFSSSSGAEFQALLNNPSKPLLNRAIQSSYPPASTFKVIMTTGILAENAFSPDQYVECPGEIDFGNRIWRCHIRKPGHGRLRLSGAMAQSCDIYYWIVGRDYLGVERIAYYARDYGFGEPTGIDLPGETSGFIPTPQWKERRLHERWVAGDTMNMSIGQSYTLATPLQMVNMTAMAANGGVVYVPRVLREIRDPVSGAVEKSFSPQVLHESDIDPEIFEAVRRDMRGVISGGTAQFPLNIRSVEIAGKTGTAEVGLQDRWHSWFTAFAPYETDNPGERVAVAVIVEAENTWEWWATYASAIIFQGIFAGQTYEEAVRTLGPQYGAAAPVQGRRE